ncbi:MAG TPA: lysophospholipid acyltransferase family protein [Methylomusa anaerophila]|uniref:1-acyl-sn-glycerol-3-phosphate acyltransferase n=1 Tax=Methylomusa anaerophila TaxID=1930071 RepID=A0A348APH3_9FIRM|nr:lysophospholipid acyltransferase family protein [Methylomusa anaerophila]BBB92971.1 1-acyl-sn-glycerol-3-phosphate acyltransferase [Methylomusa anaerophila]HML87195.1 lysophospholipid acyltransferase family protein [Methylomusa anaerophila]
MFLSLARILFTAVFTIFFRWRVYGTENIPTTGGVVIASNHISLFDPPVIGTAVPRLIHFMAKEELFQIPVFGWLIKKFNAFPVRRSTADRTAIRTALSLLATGNIVGIFPEGTRSKTGKLGSPEPGIAMIVAKAGVPVVPAAVIGTNRVFRNGCLFPQFIVKFGPPIMVTKGKTDKESMEFITTRIMSEISCLLENQPMYQ